MWTFHQNLPCDRYFIVSTTVFELTKSESV
jgi:hypothetical protein